MMARMLVKSSVLLPMSARGQPIPRGAAIVEDGVLQAVGPLEQMARLGPFEREVGSETRHIALPGFINAHHHPARPSRLGLTMGPLLGPLEIRFFRRLERALPPVTAEEAYYHTLWDCIQMIKGGVTAVVELHGGVARIDDMHLPSAVQAYGDSGLRALLCIGCADQNRLVYGDDAAFLASLPEPARTRLAPAVRPFDADAYFSQCAPLFKKHHGAEGRVYLGLGPGGAQWCSDGLLTRVRDAAREYDTKIQMHLMETKYQMLYSRRHWGTSAVQHLRDLGFLGPEVSCAHCVWLTRDDCRLLAESGATAVHNPSSNLALASGIAPVMDLLEAGTSVAFGMDTLDFNDSGDLLSDLRLAWLLQRRPGIGTPRPNPGQMLAMATLAGASALPGGEGLGSLEPGKRADIVLLDRQRIFASPYISPNVPVEEVILRRAVGTDVDAVIIDGKLILENRRILTVDEAGVQRRVATSMERFLSAAEGDAAFMRDLGTYAEEFYRRLEEEAGPLPYNYQYNTR